MDFDKLVHQPTRLQIFAYLYRHGETSFPDLKEALDVTEGNLASHIGKMEDADCVAVEKQFVDRKPQTTYELTDRGREKFEEHIGTLEALIDDLDE
ncbi:winged helix-turn-helix domain-containing protein [Halosimplex pelagicum]|uniref:Transcriptional regulator n=1 Tax=Halosimplex pelagicum TaxID=869886 RepID=A0A7D5PE41_9EURY|nr:transcriptional regulator [Halosimplex pelagicum]QLH84238.1 transcriptional regulator [Halosimplex pelagicum]